VRLYLALLVPVFAVIPYTASFGQYHTDFSKNYSDKKNTIGIAGDYQIASDAVTVEFQNAFLNNSFLNTTIKDGAFTNMDDRSVMASRVSEGIYYKRKTTESDNNFWFVAFRNRSHYNTNFTKDLFGLYFYGNKPYAGQTADLSDLNYNSIKWQQMQFGINKRILCDSSYWDITGSLSVLNGQDYLNFTTGRGTFYTHPEAEYVEMDLLLQSKQADSSNHSFGASNGFGASLDLMATYSHKDNYYLTFGIKDAGFIAWNKKSFEYTVDTLYRFEGAVVDNFFDSLYLDISSESDFIDGFRSNYKSGGFTTSLPMWMGAEFGKELMDGKVTAFAGIDYILNADYDLHIRVGGEYTFNRHIAGGAAFHAGGYAKYGWELYGIFDLSHGFLLHAGTSYLGGFVAPKNATAQGGSVGIAKVF